MRNKHNQLISTVGSNPPAIWRLTQMLSRYVRSSSTVLLGAAIIAVTLTGRAAIADADEEASGWIEKMSIAMQDLDYNGTFVYLHDGDIESMKIFHRNIDAVEYERLVSLNGEAREIIRNAEDVICIWPGSKSVIVSESKPRTPFPRFNPEQMQSLQAHYKFSNVGQARIADRPARMIDIIPRDEYRFGYRLWIDKETSLLLRSAMSDVNGKVLEQVMFTDIQMEESMPMDMFQVSSRGYTYEWLSGVDLDPVQPELQTDIPPVSQMALPHGYELTDEQISAVAGSSKPARRLMYTDGISSVSIFVAESDSESGDLLGTSTMGGVSAYGVDLGQWHATVVGEVPIDTVKMVGDSIVLAKP